ncbi:MAG: DEAD/DEAH box helicase [Proteobacteria bacterium]|nr:DEAD/DEAH box helicase [Pseudomonadota bacterium]
MADEVHTFKGRSERGIAFDRLVKATKYQLGLTGTLYGGKASDLYLLPFRLGIGNVQAEFDYDNARRWVDLYGVWEEKIRGGKEGDDRYSTFNATRQSRRTGAEKPGVSPAILHRIIENTLFLSLKDLGIGLPAYQEEVALVDMLPEQKGQYERMRDDLKDRALEDSRYLSLWLQWCLGRPNSAFRDEEIIKIHREEGKVIGRESLRQLPAIVSGEELLPKEEWLGDYCKAEVTAGRKVLVYVRQTGTRNIQPRLRKMLEKQGLRVNVLTSKVGTRKREQWVEKHEPGLDVLIVNPRLVETGLDLVQFATIVFYEIEYSLYTLWQAMRRVWRLGQQRAVKVVFTAYRGTMEADALALMGKKMQAAQLLYGDEVGGAIVPEDDGDFLSQLARTVLEGKELPDLQSLFAESTPTTTTSSVGSPTATSPRLQRLMSEMYEANRPNLNARRRKPVVSDTQLSLF